jgi:hypothetical protein
MPSPALPARRALLLTLAALALPLGAARAASRTLAGQTFAETVTLAGVPLRFNGAGLRAVAWIKGYAAALYLPDTRRDAAAVLALPGPKRLEMRLLMGAPAAELGKAVHKGVARNVSPADQPVLAPALVALDAQVAVAGQLKAGDVIHLDFEPAQGTRIRLNGRDLGAPIAEPAFYRALLLVFLGQRPVDPALKAGLLGTSG